MGRVFSVDGPRRLLFSLAWVVFAACSGYQGEPVDRVVPVIRAAAWELPDSVLGQQHLYRLRYDGPEGEGSLRVTLRLESEFRFQLSGADRLGRRHWSLDVSAGSALWIDDNQSTFCRGSASVSLPGWSDGPVRLDALPAILVGALPGGSFARDSEKRVPTADGGTRLEIEDAAGQRWSAELDGRNEMRSWTLWQRGRPTWWWRREGKGGRLSQRDGGRQLSWELVVEEPLTEKLVPLEASPGYQMACRDTSDASPSGS